MKTMPANLAGRLRNTPLPLTSGLLPLFEAVINSIHAIEDIDASTDRGHIRIEIERDQTRELPFDGDKKRGPDTHPDILGFKIIDTGIGFTDDNMESFRTLDTDYKANRGCRGIGRLLWLKAFKHVAIVSVYSAPDGQLRQRSFLFDSQSGISKEQDAKVDAGMKRKTVVHLAGFNPRYRDNSRKTTPVIGSCILEHCLWYFVRKGSAPKITVTDQDEHIDLDDVFEGHMHSSAVTEPLVIKKQSFELIHVRFRSGTRSSHAYTLCAGNRPIDEEKLAGKIPGLYGDLTDQSGGFTYMCYVTSPFLDEAVLPQRTGFNVLDTADGVLSSTEISKADIQAAVISKATDHLAGYLEQSQAKVKERVDCYVATKAPRYRPILKRIPPEKLDINPEASDKDIELLLHKHLTDIETRLLADGHDIMAPKALENEDEYRKRLQEYLDAAEDIKKSDLANYVSHRRVIIDLLEKAIQRDGDGKYQREDLIHGLIMPMRQTSDDLLFESFNLWLVDERLAFHNFLASDKTIASMPITGSKSGKEPDLLALRVFNNPILASDSTAGPFASLTVVEIKRPMRDDAAEGEDKDPVEQCLGYLERIREGKVTTAQGRPVPNADSLPGFCYVLCDLTPSVIDRCRKHGMTRSHDGMGYFHYNQNFHAYIEVISFDKLVGESKARNRAFFDKLGLPAN